MFPQLSILRMICAGLSMWWRPAHATGSGYSRPIVGHPSCNNRLVRTLLALLLLATPAAAETIKPAEAIKPIVNDTRCATPPAIKPTGFRHKRSKLIARTGSPNHRGLDLIASEDDAEQYIAGKLAHGKLDKDLEDEGVEVFACIDNAWKSLGIHRTDDDGRF